MIFNPESYAYWTVHHLDIRIKVDQPVVVQPALWYHITNSQSRYITPTRLKSAQYSLHNNAPSSRKLLKMDVLTSEICWAVNWHNKASVIKLVYLYSKTFNPLNKDFWTFCVKHVDGLQVWDYETEVTSSYVLDLQHSSRTDMKQVKRTTV